MIRDTVPDGITDPEVRELLGAINELRSVTRQMNAIRLELRRAPEGNDMNTLEESR